jgi:hypothetical protein
MREKFFEPTGGVGRQALEHVLEVTVRIVSVELRGLDRLMTLAARCPARWDPTKSQFDRLCMAMQNRTYVRRVIYARCWLHVAASYDLSTCKEGLRTRAQALQNHKLLSNSKVRAVGRQRKGGVVGAFNECKARVIMAKSASTY